MLGDQEYSEAEIRLFKALGFSEFVSTTPSVGPATLYLMAASWCFIKDRRGPEVDALRRGYQAFTDRDVYRMTPEFDTLVTFQPEPEVIYGP